MEIKNNPFWCVSLADTAAETDSGIHSQSLGRKDEKNNVQNIIFKNDFANEKQFDVYKCTEGDDVIVNIQESTQNNQTTSDLLSNDFIAQFKEKRRRFEKRRRKEKIESEVLIHSMLEELKENIRKLSAVKHGKGHETSECSTRQETKSQSSGKNIELKTAQDPHDELSNGDDGSDYNVISMEASNDDETALYTETEEISEELFTNRVIQIQEGVSSTSNQDMLWILPYQLC